MYSTPASFVLGFHGCDRKIGEAILAGDAEMRASQNDYDWLGGGCYFWEGNYHRAFDYAGMLSREKRTSSLIREPFVIGAVIDLGHCLNLLEHDALLLLREHYRQLEGLLRDSGQPMPRNAPLRDGGDLILRRLDRAVIELVHQMNRIDGKPPYDSVRGVFFEGPELYPNAGFREKNHIQICVRNQSLIKGFFRPRLAAKR